MLRKVWTHEVGPSDPHRISAFCSTEKHPMLHKFNLITQRFSPFCSNFLGDKCSEIISGATAILGFV